MAPDDADAAEPFMACKVESMMKEVLETNLKHVKYDADSCSKLTQNLCSTIKSKAKLLRFIRYKLVVHVLLGQDSEQAVQVASRCLWNHSTDNFAAATYRNSSLYAIAMVYGLHLD